MLPLKTYESYQSLSSDIAHIIAKKLIAQPRFTLGLASGNSPKLMHEELIKLLGKPGIDLSQLTTFNLDEYYPMKQSHAGSFYTEMMDRFWQPLHRANKTFDMNHGHILNGEASDVSEECSRYETLIKESGGIDLQVLGLGLNGHIAFNEPGSAIDSRTRKIIITPESRAALAKTYNDIPQFGLTIGIGTILEAREIILMVTGDGKREVFKTLMSMTEPNADIPASYLLGHPNATTYTDLLLQ